MNDVAGIPNDGGGSTDFSVRTVEGDNGHCAVAVAGDVDLLTAPQVEAAVSAAQRRSDAVLLDLAEVRFLGSAGLSVLVAAARRADESEAGFAVLVTERAVLRAIEVTGLASSLSLFEAREAAMDFLSR